jgi:tetratricopeptide (TPR) repeat protein
VVFVADDFGAWLIGALADAGRKKLVTLVLGTDQERALRAAATAAVQNTAAELQPDNDQRAAELAMVVSHMFPEPPGLEPLTGQRTLLEALAAGIGTHLAVLDDASLTSTGQSSADVLGVPGDVIADALTGHLIREIVTRGARDMPLFPLASQLNHDLTHLQGQRLEGMLEQLAGEVRAALVRLDVAAAVAVAPAVESEPHAANGARPPGPDAAGTAASRHSGGEAIELYVRTLADRERILGPDHPETLASRHNLGHAYQSAGRLGEAIRQYERALSDRERVLGPDHPDTLSSRNNLATAFDDSGRLDEAIPLYEQTLAAQEAATGPDHPETLRTRANLAAAYAAAGRHADAIDLDERTLSDRERILGPDHPDTLTSRNNLAADYFAVGQAARAIPLLRQALADRERILGPDHPDTLTSRSNLAAVLGIAGLTG